MCIKITLHWRLRLYSLGKNVYQIVNVWIKLSYCTHPTLTGIFFVLEGGPCPVADFPQAIAFAERLVRNIFELIGHFARSPSRGVMLDHRGHKMRYIAFRGVIILQTKHVFQVIMYNYRAVESWQHERMVVVGRPAPLKWHDIQSVFEFINSNVNMKTIDRVR